jgi:hypothetical protein
MSLRARARRCLVLLPTLILALTVSCGTEPDGTPQPTALQPPNDTPQNTIVRFIAAYEKRKTAEYQALFTGDFTFEFSNSADPTLADKWSTGWFAADESIYVKNLFEGGTNLEGYYLEAASSIDLIFSKTLPVADTDSGDPTKFQVLSTPVDGVWVVPPTPPATDPTNYVITNNSHRFFLVRGDAAAALKSGQPADSTHWYIWKWADETTGGAAAPTTLENATVPATWGKVKGLYR